MQKWTLLISNVEPMLYTSYYEEEGDYYGDYFYIDLYWDGEVRDWLREGTYTLGDDVLDCVEFDYDDDTVQDISALLMPDVTSGFFQSTSLNAMSIFPVLASPCRWN